MNMISQVSAADAEQSTLAAKIAQRPRWQRAAIYGTPLVLLAAAVTYWNSAPSPAAAPPAPMVTVAAPLEREINQWDDYVGRFEASRSVEVRPRVSGQVIGVHFTDGQVVQKGQLLFTIDPRPFAAALAEARASVASAQSDLALAEINLGRAKRLVEANAVSQSDVDRLSAAVRSAQAALAAARARVSSRALDVEFAYVRAPISGRISDRKIDPGNIVGANETLLTTINALDPIYFTFDVPESLYLKTARQRQANRGAGETAEIRLQDEAQYSWRGKLDFTDNGISQNSGTIRARAVVANPTYFLAPGMFGNMRLADGGTTPALRGRVVLLDWDLPGRDGLTVLRGLAAEGVLDETSVIMLTARASEREVVAALDLGAADHVAKPISLPVLMQKVRRAAGAPEDAP